MNRIFVMSVVLVASTAGAAAQEGTSSEPQRFSREAIRPALVGVTPTEAARSNLPGQASVPRLTTNSSWDHLVSTLTPGRKVSVTLADGTHVEGALHAIDAHSVAIEQPGESRLIRAADVVRVRYVGIRKRHMLYGMLIGAAGTAVLIAIDQHSSHPSSKIEGAEFGIFFGLPIGALAGAALPIGAALYEADSSDSQRERDRESVAHESGNSVAARMDRR